MSVKLDPKDAALQILAVSRETENRLAAFERLILRWQARINLVSPYALNELWMRHIADSGQLVRLAPPTAARWVDIGSGGGFPGAVIGILLSERPGAEVHLIESNRRKAEFLKAVSRETGAPLIVHCERAERALASIDRVDVVTSRATASLGQLLDWTAPLIRRGTLGLFLKGETVRDELTSVGRLNSISLALTPSLTNPLAAVVIARASCSDPHA